MGENTKYLEVQVDQQLKLSSQLTSTIRKNSKGIGILRYFKRIVPASTVKLMYKSLVGPYLRYRCPRAARTVTGRRYDQSALPIFRALGWPSVRELIDLETLKMVFKSLNGEA